MKYGIMTIRRMKVFFILSIISCCISCNQGASTNAADHPDTDSSFLVANEYSETSIPSFLKAFIDNHLADFARLDSARFNHFCNTNNVNPKDSLNVRNYFNIEIVHRLLTSKAPVNGSVGDIISIPYYWHWVSPNPRHDIFDVETYTRLGEIKTLPLYPKYSSFADIDRTPYLFLSDLFGEFPKYRSALCDSFSTFGWCSEREMSFVFLLEMLGIEGKTIAENNHSWSLLHVKMKDGAGKQKSFKVKVDNTYDQLTWSVLTKTDSLQWHRYLGTAPLARWYNAQAHSQKEKERLASVRVAVSATTYIEESTIQYLQNAMRNK